MSAMRQKRTLVQNIAVAFFLGVRQARLTTEDHIRKTAILIAVWLVMGATASAQPPPPKVMPAIDGIFEAFKTHPLVGLGEMHGLAQEFEVYFALVQDPRFADQVGNVILETGSASNQAIVDRYVNGHHVPYAELRKVWADTVGWFPAVTGIGAIRLYAAIRIANAKLPPEKRIKVWLGEPPIDWQTIKTKSDWEPLSKQRDSHPAELARREILANRKKALLIYGVGHFGLYPIPTLRMLLDKTDPGALFVIAPYVGYAQKDCAARFERHITGWKAPSLAWPIRGSALEADIWTKGCDAFANIPEERFENATRNNVGLTADALLYLGPRASLLRDGTDPDALMDLDYRAELARRYELRTGEPLPPPNVSRQVSQPFLED